MSEVTKMDIQYIKDDLKREIRGLERDVERISWPVFIGLGILMANCIFTFTLLIGFTNIKADIREYMKSKTTTTYSQEETNDFRSAQKILYRTFKRNGC